MPENTVRILMPKMVTVNDPATSREVALIIGQMLMERVNNKEIDDGEAQVILDADGHSLGSRTLTHQTAGVADKPSLAQSINAVGGELRTWILADRIALADDDSDAVGVATG